MKRRATLIIILSALALPAHANAADHSRLIKPHRSISTACPAGSEQTAFDVYTRAGELVPWDHAHNMGDYWLFVWRSRGIRVSEDKWTLRVRNGGKRTARIKWSCG